MQQLPELFRGGRAVWILVALNLAVYVAAVAGGNAAALALPAGIDALCRSPWTLITYMFAQDSLQHLVFNLVMLILAGCAYERIFSSARLATAYIVGGLAGALAFETLYAAIGTEATLQGSSAAAMAVCAALVAHLRHNLPHIDFASFRIDLRWFMAAYVAYCAVCAATGENPGGNVAHIGGIVAGYILGCIKPRRKVKIKAKHPLVSKAEQSGYLSLTDDERRRLFDHSSKK